MQKFPLSTQPGLYLGCKNCKMSEGVEISLRVSYTCEPNANPSVTFHTNGHRYLSFEVAHGDWCAVSKPRIVQLDQLGIFPNPDALQAELILAAISSVELRCTLDDDLSVRLYYKDGVEETYFIEGGGKVFCRTEGGAQQTSPIEEVECQRISCTGFGLAPGVDLVLRADTDCNSVLLGADLVRSVDGKVVQRIQLESKTYVTAATFGREEERIASPDAQLVVLASYIERVDVQRNSGNVVVVLFFDGDGGCTQRFEGELSAFLDVNQWFTDILDDGIQVQVTRPLSVNLTAAAA